MFKRVFISIMLLAALLLAACSESKSAKEVSTDAMQSLMDAKSYEATSSLDVNLDVELEDPFVQPYIQMLNEMEFSLDQRVDMEKQIQEMVIHFKGSVSPMTFNVELPILQDIKNQKMYIKTDSLIENFGMMLPLPEEAKGKLIEIDLAQMEGAQTPEINYEEITKKAQTIMNDFLKNKSEEDFSKDGDTYTVKFHKEEFADLVAKFVEEFDETVSEEELQTGIEEMNKALEKLTLNTFEVQFTMDGDQVKSQKFVFDGEFEVEGKPVKLGLTADTNYKSINEGVEFTIDPENSEIIDMQQFEQMIPGAMAP